MTCLKDPGIRDISQDILNSDSDLKDLYAQCSGTDAIASGNWGASTPGTSVCYQSIGNYIYNNGYNAQKVEYLNPLTQTQFKLQSTPQGVGTELLKVCEDFPLVCNSYLNEACEPCTKLDVSRDKYLTRLCGCYSVDNFTDLRNPCDQVCLNTQIKSEADVYGNKVNCSQTVCIIDDVTVNMAVNSTAGKENVTVNQLCNQCELGECVCYIDLSALTGNINIDVVSDCNGSVCLDSTGKEVSCPKTIGTPSTSYTNILIAVTVFLLLLAFFLVLNVIV